MAKWILTGEAPYGTWEELSRHESEWDAIEAMYKAFDSGEPKDFKIKEDGSKNGVIYPAHRLLMTDCPRCGRKVRTREMLQTYDCHGIPFRLVCEECYCQVMEDPGYDGEYYTEEDEQIEPDW